MFDKVGLGVSVLVAAQERISWTFNRFEKIYVSFSGGKDSTVMLHLVMQEAIKRNKKVGVLFVDLEAQYQLTIECCEELFKKYQDYIEPHWVALPIALRNAVSQFEPKWTCWDNSKKDVWVRPQHKISITDKNKYPFYKDNMEFEEFVPEFGKFFAQGKSCACLVGIRSDESLNRWRTLAMQKTRFENKSYTTRVTDGLWNVYPIYDWKTADIWRFHAKFPNLTYNKIYDLFYKAGLTISQMRICQPYGDDQRKGLYLYQVIEPNTWAKVVARVNGANSGALYSQESGNINGTIKVTKPENHTWESFAMLLLNTMPSHAQEHYKNKIAIFIRWYEQRGYPNGIPDEIDYKQEANRTAPSWRRICKSLLRNDYWGKGLGFSQTKTQNYKNYLKNIKEKRRQWKILMN
jgi:predicted phosphoadenosine phosphosulfate sulfurtransferase